MKIDREHSFAVVSPYGESVTPICVGARPTGRAPRLFPAPLAGPLASVSGRGVVGVRAGDGRASVSLGQRSRTDGPQPVLHLVHLGRRQLMESVIDQSGRCAEPDGSSDKAANNDERYEFHGVPIS